MRRHQFIRLLGGTLAWPFAVRAQQSSMPLIGVLHGVSAAQWTDRMVGFHRGLGEAGFAEGGNVTIEYRWAEGHFDRLPAMAADLVGRKVAVICAGAGDVAIRAAMAATKTTQRLGLELIVVKAGSEGEIESAVGDGVGQLAQALSIGNDAYLSSRSRQIAFFALRHALPTMSESRDGVAAGLLVSYGPNQAETFRRAGLYVGRILKGEKPADLPVIQPTNFELFINLTTAKALGLQIPGQLLGRADELIE